MQNTSLEIRAFALGDWQTNCYVIHAKDSNRCWLVDAGFEPFKLIQFVKQSKLEPQEVLLTHAHIDHIAGLIDVRRHWPDLPIRIHPSEVSFLVDPMLNLSAYLPEPMVMPEATGTFDHGDVLDIDGIRCEVRHTPGHSPGGVTLCFPSENLAIVGDTLFRGSVGRSDFPTSDEATLFRSIHEQLLTLPRDTRILPGHGAESTIAAEKLNNPFLQ